MNENRYIQELAEALAGLGEDEREAILQDYRQHFRDGRAQGHSDADIAATLGQPQDAAAAYLEGWAPPPPPRRRFAPWLVGLIAVVAVALVVTVGWGMLRGDAEPAPPVAGEGDPTDGGNGVNISLPGLSVQVDDDGLASVNMGDGIHFEGDLGDMLSALGNLGTRTVGRDETKELSHGVGYPDCTEIVVDGSYQLGCKVITYSGDDVFVSMSGRIPTAHDVDVSQQDGELTIRYRDNGAHLSIDRDYAPLVTIALPTGGQLEKLAVNTLSGPVDIVPPAGQSRTFIERLSVGTVSGAVTLAAGSGDLFAFGRLDAETVSGPVDIWYLADYEAVTLQTISGTVDAVISRDGDIRAETVSGDIRLGTGVGPVRAESISGDILLQLSGINGPLGNTEVISVQCETVSGTIVNQLGRTQAGDIVNRCETVSGDITVTGWPDGGFQRSRSLS